MRVISYFILVLALLTSCSGNLFESTAETDTDAARLVNAIQFMNASSWDLAIAEFDEMSADYLADRDVNFERARAYAGRCGLSFTSLLTAIEGYDGSSPIFPFFMSAVSTNTASYIDDCIQAEALMTGVGAVGDRTSAENTLLFFVEVVKIGVILSVHSDRDNDGTADAGFAPCTDGTGSGDTTLPQLSAQHLATGIGLMVEGISSGDVPGTSSLTTISTACTTIAASLPASYNFCSVTDVADVTTDMEKGIRTLVGEQDELSVGLGACGGFSAPNRTLANCICL